MKTSIITALMALFCLKCFGQTNLNAWLPEKYVRAELAKDTSAYKYQIPIEGFESLDKNPRILVYKGEVNSVNMKKVTIAGKEKYQLLNLQYYVNLKYNSRELAKRMGEATIYVSKVGQKLLLEIIEKNQKQEIYFIDRINGYVFKGILEAEEYLEKK